MKTDCTNIREERRKKKIIALLNYNIKPVAGKGWITEYNIDRNLRMKRNDFKQLLSDSINYGIMECRKIIGNGREVMEWKLLID